MISIVVPVYNVEKYLSQCVDSILSQSYQDFELILVDDGSKDNCPRLCDEYATQDSRVKVIHKKNGGLSDARNYGIEQAKGEYITFVDSDDLMLPTMLEMLWDMSTQASADIACCGHMRCDDQETIRDLQLPMDKADTRIYRNDRMDAFMKDDGIGSMAWAKLYKTALFQQVRYPVGKYHEDVFTTYRLIHLAECVAVTDGIGYVYRRNPQSITLKFSPKRLDSVEAALQRAQFVAQNYPHLEPYAWQGVIYACNTCTVEMAKAGYRDPAVEKRLQIMYRAYGKYYCRLTHSFKKNLFVRLSQINLGIARVLSKYV